MRFLKIITISSTLIFFCAFLYFLYFIVLPAPGNAPLLAYIYLVLIFITVIIAVVYQFKSYRFYRNAESVHLSKKLSKILWAGAISFYCLLLFLAGIITYETVIYRIGFVRLEQLALLGGFLFLGGMGLLEVSLLKKRIKRLNAELVRKDEIESIGDSAI